METTFLPNTMNERLRDVMKARNLTQSDLAKQAGVPDSTISRFIRGETTKLNVDTVIRISKVLRVSTDFLLGETDVPDRMGYYLEELGLTAKAAENLYTGKADPQVVSSLLENERFQHLTYLLLGYLNDTTAKGFAVQNQMFQMVSGAMTSYPGAQKEIDQLKIDPRMAEKANLQAEFIASVQELKVDGGQEVQTAVKCMSEVMNTILQSTTKRTGMLRPTITMEQIADGVIKAVENQTGPLDQSQKKSLKKSWRETVQVLLRNNHGAKP